MGSDETFDFLAPGRNAAPAKVQCAECHWMGSTNDLVLIWQPDSIGCPICKTPFARYPQRAEHLWSDPY